MITVDYTITVGNLIEIVSILGGGVLVLLTMRSDIASLKKQDENLTEEMSGIQTEIKKIGDLLTKQATMDVRLMHVEQDIRDLRRGRGLIVDEDT